MEGSRATGRKLVGARELKTRLGKYLRAVQRGSTITITDRGVPVACLSPLAKQEEGLDAVLDGLDSEGIISKGKGGTLQPGRAIRAPRGEDIARTIERDRADRL